MAPEPVEKFLAELKPGREITRVIRNQITALVPEEHHEHALFGPLGLRNMLASTQDPAFYHALATHVLPAVPREWRMSLIQQGASNAAHARMTARELRAQATIAKKYAKEFPDHEGVQEYVTRHFGRLSPNVSTMRLVVRHVPMETFGSADRLAFSSGVPRVLDAKLNAKAIREQARRAVSLRRAYGGGLLGSRVVAENFGGLPARSKQAFHPLWMEKKHYQNPYGDQKLGVMGGRLTGVMVRVVPKDAYGVWLSAQHAGIPVEPILYKNGKPRAKEFVVDSPFRIKGQREDAPEGKRTMVRVWTRYAGENALDYYNAHPEHQAEIFRQLDAIKKQLEVRGIDHGDSDKMPNYTVEVKRGKPIVRLVDWELASSKLRPDWGVWGL